MEILNSQNILLSAQETILNHYLNLDPEAKGRLSRLSGKVVKIEWGHLNYYWLFKSDSIYLSKDYHGAVDLILRGSILDFIRIAFIKKDTALTTIPLEILGDMEFAKQFKDLFSNLEIDWEEQLAALLGDTIAYPLSCFFKEITRWAKQSVESLSQNTTNYLQTELNYLVSEPELQIFFSDIDDLRDDSERLEARINVLQRGLD